MLPTFPHIYPAPFIIEIDLARIYQTATAAVISAYIFLPFTIYELLYSRSPRSTTVITINCELYLICVQKKNNRLTYYYYFAAAATISCVPVVVRLGYFISSPSAPSPPMTFSRPKGVYNKVSPNYTTNIHTRNRVRQERGGQYESKSETRVILYYGEISVETDHPDSIYIYVCVRVYHNRSIPHKPKRLNACTYLLISAHWPAAAVIWFSPPY